MPNLPDVSVIVTTYQRPHNLERVLESLAVQDFSGTMEVVVADDGSCDQTQHVVLRHTELAPHDVRFVTHQHEGFRLSYCRNEGVREARAPYLILLDGDCVAPPCHIANHLRLRRQDAVVSGTTCYLSQLASQQLDQAAIEQGRWRTWESPGAFRALRRAKWKANFYSVIGHPIKPRLLGGNFGIWRSNYERVNGFDENFQGWGCEDDDFGMRLRRAGSSLRVAFDQIPTFHLWHPQAPSVPKRWREGANVDYFQRKVRWTRCVNGLNKRPLHEMHYVLRGDPRQAAWVAKLLAPATELPPDACLTADIEVIIPPEPNRFSGQSDCNVLILPGEASPAPRATQQADVILADRDVPKVPRAEQFPLDEFSRFLRLSNTNPSASRLIIAA